MFLDERHELGGGARLNDCADADGSQVGLVDLGNGHVRGEIARHSQRNGRVRVPTRR